MGQPDQGSRHQGAVNRDRDVPLGLHRALIALVLAVCAHSLVHAEDSASAYPKGPVRLVIPFPPGGPTDSLGRILAQRLQEAWGQPVLSDYKPGAGTVIGIDAVAKSTPDGMTIGLVNSAYTINPVLLNAMPYDTLRDLTAVTQVVTMTMALLAYPGTPFNTFPELLAYARGHPATLSYATPGAGGAAHLAGELLNRSAGIDLLHVPYKGSSPAQTDVMAGRVDLMFDPLFSALPFVRAGKLKVIALAAERPVAGFEQYSVINQTVSGVVVSAMLGLVVPAATPPAIVQRIQSDVARALDPPAERRKIADLGMEVMASTPAEFDRFVRSEMQKWSRVIREAHIAPPQ